MSSLRRSSRFVVVLCATVLTVPVAAGAKLPQQDGSIDLAAPGTGAVAVKGITGEWSGFAADVAGDVNGDGVGDLIIGAPQADYGSDGAGSAYVVFGPLSGDVDLGNLGSKGFRIDGAANADFLGRSVGGAGDVNGDGRADLVVGATGAGTPDGTPPGRAYIVFGRTASTPVNVGSLGAGGFAIKGSEADGLVGWSVARAGDVDGDGRSDVVVGATQVDAPGNGTSSGAAWVIFGKATPGDVDLAALGSGGIAIDGPGTNAYAGWAVGGIRDVSGDGKAEVGVGAPGLNASNGIAYSVFGGGPGARELATLGSGGTAFGGTGGTEEVGIAMDGGPDIAGDGKDDWILGSRGTAASNTGAAWVLFGSSDTAAIDLDTPGARGFKISGAAAGDHLGPSVASVGDVAGDGRADLAVAAPCADRAGRTDNGAVHVVFGDPAGSDVNLATLPASRGYRIDGAEGLAGGCPSLANEVDLITAGGGDVTGDARADVLVGNPRSDLPGTNAGITYVVRGYGVPSFDLLAHATGKEGDAFAVGPSGIRRTGPASFAVQPPLPSGIVLDPASGVMSGVPTAGTAAGDHVVAMTDLYGSTTRTIRIAVHPKVVPPLPDTDGDGVVDAVDKCDRLKAGRYDVDKDGCAGPFKVFSARFNFEGFGDGRLRALSMGGVPRAASVTVRCARCPKALRTLKRRTPVTRTSLARVLRRLRGVQMRRKVLVITITAPGTIGKRLTLRFDRRGRLPTSGRTSRCLQPGSAVPRRSCDTTPGVPGGTVK